MKITSRTLLLFCLAPTLALIGCRCSNTGEGATGNEGGNEGDADYRQTSLYVENRTLKRDGKPYYGMGINYFRLFNDYAAGDYSTLRGLMALADAGVPFVRFPASPYWPISWQTTYFTDKREYFRKLDRIVEIAEEQGIGLIPSLFWHMPTFPDLMGEHMDAYSDSNSKTIAFVKSYTAEVVERYKDSPAIWGWEFGNEFNLFIDIPHDSRPPNPPGLGCPAERDPVRDQFKNSDMINAFNEFGRVVRRIDPHRAIFSGNSEPRPAAWHLANEGSWTPDDYGQYKQIVEKFECGAINTVTVRAYCNYGVAASRYPLGLKKPSDYIAAMMRISRELGKPLFVGEFCASDDWLGEAKEDMDHVDDVEEAFRERVNAIVDNKVPLSAVWVYDLPQQDASCSITFDNHRAYMIDEIVKANAELRKNIPE